MYSKILFQIFCLSLALVQIRAHVRANPGHYYPIQYDVQPIADSTEQKEQEFKENQEHWGQHPGRHHNIPRDIEGRAEGAPNHELRSRVLPLLQTLVNKKYQREDRIETNDDSNYNWQVTQIAQIASSVHTKMSKTIIGNGSQIITKVLEQDAKSDVVFELNSSMDSMSDKKSVNKSIQESKPNDNQIIDIEHAKLNPDKKLWPIKTEFRTLSKHLRRMKRDDLEAGSDTGAPKMKNSWDKIVDSVNTVGKHVKDAVDQHIVKPIKKAFDGIKNKPGTIKKKPTDKDDQSETATAHAEK